MVGTKRINAFWDLWELADISRDSLKSTPKPA
jgi:hypothetical protein